MLKELREFMKALLNVRLGQVLTWLCWPALGFLMLIMEGANAGREVLSEIRDQKTLWGKFTSGLFFLFWLWLLLAILFGVGRLVLEFYRWLLPA